MSLDALKFMRPEPYDQARRLCVCLSDIHCTDGTVGQQSADPEIWPWTFSQIQQLCETFEITHLQLLLVGDIVDMIRTRQWANPDQGKPFYPWDGCGPQCNERLQTIFEAIVQRHAKPPESLFNQLKEARRTWPGQALPKLKELTVVPILGNHDKEILRDTKVLKAFWEELMGMPLDQIPTGYRNYLSEQYDRDFSAPGTPPWPPFYWVDAGFRLFATHGQWRDPDNHAAIDGWSSKEGWRPKSWQRAKYTPFTKPCFGDTVAAGLLSGYISIAKEKLLADPATAGEDRNRILHILDELDLYRPSYAAVERLEKEIQRLARREGHASARRIKTILESTLLDQVRLWLSWPFTRASAPLGRRLALSSAHMILGLAGRLAARRTQGLRLKSIYLLFRFLHWRDRLKGWRDDMPDEDLLKLPAFTDPACKVLGLQLHVEGHTHTPMEADLDIGPHKNRGYINLGTWRNRVVKKQIGSYRRRGVGRLLCILDLPGEPEREFRYWVIDFTQWKASADRLE